MATKSASKKSTAKAGATLLPAAEFAVGAGGELHQVASPGQPVLTTNHGMPVGDDHNSLKAGLAARRCSRISSFARRSSTSTTSAFRSASSHARGLAAHGYFELTDSLEKYTTAKVLTEVGVRTPVFTRFSDRRRQQGLGRRGARRARLRSQILHQAG